MDSSQNASGDRMGPLVIKEVLQRLAQRRLSPDPENFSRVYREVSSAFALPVERQYTDELAAMRHLIEAFDNLLIGNAWLNGKFRELGRTVNEGFAQDEDRLANARRILNEVAEGKAQALGQAARLVVELREALSEMIAQAQELAQHVSATRSSFERAQELAVDCVDLDDVKAAMRAMALDARRLNRAAEEGKQEITSDFAQFSSSSRYLFGPPVAVKPPVRRTHDQKHAA